MIPPGPGKRQVVEEEFTINDLMKTSDEPLIQLESSSFSSEDVLLPAVEKKPVVLLADSMGTCFTPLDHYFTPVVKDSYNFDSMATDVVEEVVIIKRYKNIVVWAGAHAIHRIDLEQVEADLKGLLNVVMPRNRKATVYVSNLIPKPRENHLTAPRFARYNEIIKKVVADFQAMGQQVYLLDSESIFLDAAGDIVRPIIENFEDGFHLNCNGAQKLRQYWLKNIKSV